MSSILRWSFFGLLVLFYCLVYAPYGINETDGGFMTGLAWQVLNGKVLYQDVVYVRPPLSVWLRCLELRGLPEPWAVLGERCFFYLKVAAYSLLGASVLTAGWTKWWLTLFGFVVSAHCYPPAAWHTTDGILFGVLAVYLATRQTERQSLPLDGNHRGKVVSDRIGSLLSGVAIALALGCKQSFYPLLLLFFLGPYPTLRARFWAAFGFLSIVLLFIIYLIKNNLLFNYLSMTGGATSGAQAFQHGIADYFRIQPPLVLVSAVCFLAAIFLYKKGVYGRIFPYFWFCWLLLLVVAYLFSIHQRQEFTIPFAQSRLLFWVAAGYALCLGWRQRAYLTPKALVAPPSPSFFALASLLLVTWCAAVSWGYNLPILFATPWVFTAMVLSKDLWAGVFPRQNQFVAASFAFAVLIGVFRYGYEFVYRDGRRGDMTADMGAVFPKLRGIRSTETSAALYRDLKNLTLKYGPAVKTLPSFPQAAFLTGTFPVLPLDWVVEREMGGHPQMVLDAIAEKKPILLIEKQYSAQLNHFTENNKDLDPELRLARQVLAQGHLIEETPYFWVVAVPRE